MQQENGPGLELKKPKDLTLEAAAEAFNETNVSHILKGNDLELFQNSLKMKNFDVSNEDEIKLLHKVFRNIQDNEGKVNARQVDETEIKIVCFQNAFNELAVPAKRLMRNYKNFKTCCDELNITFQGKTVVLNTKVYYEHKKVFDAFNAVKGKDGQVHFEGIKRLRREPTIWQSFCAAVGGIGEAGKIGKAKKNFQAEARKLMKGITSADVNDDLKRDSLVGPVKARSSMTR